MYIHDDGGVPICDDTCTHAHIWIYVYKDSTLTSASKSRCISPRLQRIEAVVEAKQSILDLGGPFLELRFAPWKLQVIAETQLSTINEHSSPFLFAISSSQSF